MKLLQRYRAFTLMELMIAIGIVGIIATIAVPSYIHNTRRAYYSELVMATIPYKMGIADCYKVTSDLTKCNGGKYGIPPDITTPFSGIAMLTVKQGQITVVPVNKNGIENSDTYILTPKPHPSGLIGWEVEGGALAKGYVK